MSFRKTEPPPNIPAMYVEGTEGQNGQPALVFDVEQFDKILNRPDIPEAERHAALQELWQLIAMFIDIGWGVHSRSSDTKISGQSVGTPQKSAILGEDVVCLNLQSLMEEFFESTKRVEDEKGAPHERLQSE